MFAGARRLGSWIEAFLEYTEILPSPLLMRKWAAISFVAAALERRVWIRSMGSDLYPNLYTFLVGPPGVGKSVALNAGEKLLREIPDMKVGPSDMSGASLVDALYGAVRQVILRDPQMPYIEFNSLTVISRELGVLIPSWDPVLMHTLTDIYDGCIVEQKRRGRDLHIKIPNPQINLIGACTPSYLNETMPPGAWDQGFISRSIMVYSGERVTPDLFAEDEANDYITGMQADLLNDLKIISVEFGQIKFTATAATAIKAWIAGRCQPEPSHMRLQSYNSRRISHLLKLCMVASMSHRSDRIITLEDYSEALNWLIEVESYMPDIFKSMQSGGDSSAMEEAWNYVWTIFSKEKRPVVEHRVVHFLRERVPAHSVMRVLEVMVKSRMFEVVITDNQFQGYRPTSRTQRLDGT